MIKIPNNDPAIIAYDEKKAAVDKLRSERLSISQQKEQRRQKFVLERQENSRGLIDADGRDLGRMAYEEATRELDAREGQLLRDAKRQEKELERAFLLPVHLHDVLDRHATE